MRKIKLSLPKALPYILIIGGIVGLICSFVLMYDQIKVWENPNYSPACSFNPVVSCGTVIDSGKGKLFGIPGPFFGQAAFAAIATVGVAILAGARLKRWFWLGVEAGLIAGLGYALWLFWLSMYKIHALCPFCLAVDVVMYTLIWYVTLYNIDKGHIKLPKGKAQAVYGWVRKHHLDLLILWFLVLAALILNHFWYYYGQYFGS